MAHRQHCTHLDQIDPYVEASDKGCTDCLAAGMHWVHLRECLVCGHVGCCDSSVGKHATKHFQHTHHAIMQSVEPGEHWGWCYVDEMMLELPA